MNMEPQECKLLDENTACFVKTRDQISNYQKISTMMCTDNWIPFADHLKEIHESYVKCKRISNVKHWLNELRMLYNACQMLTKNQSENDNVYIMLYFKTYPMEYTEIILLYIWFCNMLQQIYDKEKCDSSFSTTMFFKEMFRKDFDSCLKHIYLNNEKVLVSIDLVTGKEMSIDSFIILFNELVVHKKSNCLLTLIQLYSCFQEYYFLNRGCNLDEFLKPKSGYEYDKYASIWLRKMLYFLQSHCGNNFFNVYKMFQPHLNDYLVCIPNGNNLKQFHVKCDTLEKIVAYDTFLDKEKLCVIDLLVNSKYMQSHTEYLENLNMYLYVFKNQTSASLIEEMKCLYYKFNVEKLKSSSDSMLKKSLENYHVTSRKFHNTVFQQWLIQKMKAIMQNNVNLFSMFTLTLPANYKKLILEKSVANNLPSPEEKEYFMNIVNAHPDPHSCFIILLNFFVCHVESKNITIEILQSDKHSGTETLPGCIGKAIEKLEYKDEAILLSQNDLIIWNMLFNQNDVPLNKLRSWLHKAVRELSVKDKIIIDRRKFEIPYSISNHYLKFLNLKKHCLSNYIISQIAEKLSSTSKHNNSSSISIQENLNNLHSLSKDFIEEVEKLHLNVITDQNKQLVVNIINYVNCFLGIQKFHVSQTGNGYILHQNKTYDIENSSGIATSGKDVSVTFEHQKTNPSEMNNSNLTHSSLPLEVNVIHTKAIIEHCEPNTRKRPLENGTHKPESPKQKKSCHTVNERDLSVVSEPSPTNCDNAIINESNVQTTNPKVTVFEDQFKKKLNNLTQEYSDLIDITNVKVKQEKETSSESKPLSGNSTITDSGNVSNDSSDESDVIVLGPGPPKQFDVITLNENGEEIEEKSEKSEDIVENQKDTIESNKDNSEKEKPQAKEIEKSPSVEKEVQDEEVQMEICTFPKKWTQKMIDFYSEDVNPELFKQKIQSQLSRTRPDQWWFEYHKSYRFHDSQFAYNKICDNCGSRLHDPKNCPKPCFSVCPMCGERGHAPDRCPESQCLNCGKKTDEYLFNCEECDQKVVLKIKCDVCHRLYHSNDNCPFLWRSMEFTTRKGKLKVIPGGSGSSNTKYCSNCAGRGHLIEECGHLSSEHPLRQDSTWKVLNHAYTTHLVHYKLRVRQQVSRVLLSKSGMALLQKLSNQSGVNIEYLVDEGVNVLMYKANPVQSHFIRSQLKKHLFAS